MNIYHTALSISTGTPGKPVYSAYSSPSNGWVDLGAGVANHTIQSDSVVPKPAQATHSPVLVPAAFERHYDVVESLWNQGCVDEFSPEQVTLIDEVMSAMEQGLLRAAFCDDDGQWTTRQWLLHALCLAHKTTPVIPMAVGDMRFCDQQFDRFQGWSDEQWAASKLRVYPGGRARRGSYLGKGVVLVGFVGAGAYVADNSLIDGFTNIGSGAQIGKNVHVSAGACIGGVLEPMQKSPVIIEDNCFIGGNCVIVEGVVIEKNAVIAAGTCLTQSTKIYDRATGTISYGRVPAGSVVVPGSLPSKDGTHHITCAVIVKQVDHIVQGKLALSEYVRS